MAPIDAHQSAAADLFRLYRPEWIIVHFVTADDNGDECPRLIDQVHTHFNDVYQGRVRLEDVRYTCEGEGINAVAQLQLRLPNLKGEFKYASLAENFAHAQGYDEYTIVPRNSKADHAIRDYSIKKLPA